MNGLNVVGQVSRSIVFIVLGALCACGGMDFRYFEGQMNRANQVEVAGQYGPPHKVDRLSDGGAVWTYFERGSGTAGFTGSVQTSYCRAYLLTFDQTEVLRDWKQQDCATRPAPVTEPFSDRR